MIVINHLFYFSWTYYIYNFIINVRMKFSYSKNIDYISFHSFVSGPNAATPTLKWDVYGTDLGIPCYSKQEKMMYLFFGDTFSTPLPSDVNWRGTVIGRIKDLDFSKGIIFNDFVCDDEGRAKNVIKHHKCKNEEYYEVTKICQGAVEVNGVLYAFYESIRSWGEPGYWDVNYSGAIKSYDHGQTWIRCHDLTWVGKIDKYEDVIKELVTEDIDMNKTDIHIDIHAHHIEAFSQIYPYDGNDGYIYILGRRGGRQYGVSLGRVKVENIEQFEEYEYYVNQKWIKGYEGIKQLNENELNSYIIPLPVSNITIAFNKYLNKYIALYYKPNYGVVIRTAKKITGPFIDEQLLIKQDDEHLPATPYGLYGGFTHELMSKDNGQTIYFIVSQWNKQVYLSELFELKFN